MADKQINCRLILKGSYGHHILQVLTGYSMLARSGIISLCQECVRETDEKNTTLTNVHNLRSVQLRVVINDTIKVVYDMHDSYEIDKNSVEWSDVYFKRSYARSLIPGEYLSKVYSYGLNYVVYPSRPDMYEIERLFLMKEGWRIKQSRISAMFRLFGDSVLFVPTERNIYAEPDLSSDSSVIFMTQAWDPEEGFRTKEKQMERLDINNMRADCIRLLRRKFKNQFIGGFANSEYALRNYGDLVFSNIGITRKSRYLRELRRHQICIATKGLHGSNGGKLGEYVAFSKAIVSETLNYEVPGNFESGKHYLSFSTPVECVEKVTCLMDDKMLRNSMMTNNNRYYLRSLRPDILLLNTIDVALNACAKGDGCGCHCVNK